MTTKIIETFAGSRHVVTLSYTEGQSRPWFVDITPPMMPITGEYPATAGGRDDAIESYEDAVLRVREYDARLRPR